MANTTYATIAELKERVSIVVGDTGSDTLLQQVLNTAAWLVDKYTRGARLGYEAFSASASETRIFDDENTGFVSIDDATAIASVTRAGTLVDAAYWQAYPYQSGAANLPITGIQLRYDQTFPIVVPGTWYNYPWRGEGAGQISIVGTWGYCTSGNRPSVIKEATLLQAATMVQAVGRDEKPRFYDQLDGLVAAMLGALVRRVYVI